MTEVRKRSFLRNVYSSSPKLLKRQGVLELVRAYEDLEKTLKGLKKTYGNAHMLESSIHSINVKKLIDQLSRSKKKLERKIGNTLLLEKQQWEKKFRAMTSNLRKH